MRILILSHLYPSNTMPSYGVFVHEQVRELKKQGCDVQVVSPVKSVPFPLKFVSAKWKRLSSIPQKEIIDDIPVYHPRYPSLPKNLLFEQSGQIMYKCISNLIKKLHSEKKFDFIHAHVALPDGFAAYKLSEELKIPFLVTIHGQDFQKTIHLNEKCKENINLTLNKASKVILVSSKLERLLKESKFTGQINYKIIPNGIDVEKVKITTSEQYFHTKGPRLLSVSNLYLEKAIDINIKAVSQLIKKYPELEYLIVGDGPKKQELEALVQQLDLQNNVRFLGAFKHEHVFSIMKQCDVFSMPSINEAFGVVYIEAMLLGKPVIGCIGEGPQDIVHSGEDGFLIKKNDVEQLSTTLDQLFQDKEFQQTIGIKAKHTVENRYRWEIVAGDIMEQYNEILS